MKNKNWTIVGALVFGLLVGWHDFNAEEVQLSALLIMAFSFGFSAANPKKAWLIALLMGGGIPVVSFTARALGYKPLFETTPWYAGIILPLAFAFVAAYAGVLFNWILRKAAPEK
jgi:amino acid permease